MTHRPRIAVLASGQGTNLQSLLDARDRIGADVTLVVSDRTDAPALERARTAGVPAVLCLPPGPDEAREAYDTRLRDAVRAEDPDVVVLAGFMRILTPVFVDAFHGRIINIHPALLPSFRGAHGVRDTLRAGARLAGCTTHIVTPELDGGPILMQAAIPVHGDDLPTLKRRVLELEHQILPRTVQLFVQGRIHVEGGAVRIDADDSWADQAVPGAVYSDGF